MCMEYICCQPQMSSILLDLTTSGCIHLGDILLCICCMSVLRRMNSTYTPHLCIVYNSYIKPVFKVSCPSKQSVNVILSTWITKKLDSLNSVPSTSSPFRSHYVLHGYFRPPPPAQSSSNTNGGCYKGQLYHASLAYESCQWRALGNDNEAIASSPGLVQCQCRLTSEALPVRFCRWVLRAGCQSKHPLQECSHVSL